MATLTEIAEVTAAVGGLLGGAAGIISAVRRDAATAEVVAQPAPARPTAPRGDEDWTATAHGLLALGIAAVAVLLAGRRGDVDDTPLTVLRWAVTVPLACAVYFGARSLYEALTHRRRGLLLSACTGLAAAAGALAAILLAGSPA